MAAPILPESPLHVILAKLLSAKRAGEGWMARCPAHDDREASLSLKEGRDGRVVLKCHAGCTVEAVVQAVGLTMSDTFPEHLRKQSKKRDTYDANARPRQTASYDYVDESGTLLYQAIRLEYPDGRKTFRQRRPDGNNGWTYSLGETRLVPYRLPELHAGIAQGRVVLIVEGEKDVETLIEAGYVATTNPMGAGKWRDEFSPLFRGAMVVILPDNDDTGRTHAQAVAQSVHAAGAKWVRVCELPGLPPKGDVTDWLDVQGHDLDELQEMIGQSPLWHPDPSKRTRWRLDELWENDNIMRPPPAIVPRLAFAGRSTMLASGEKAGKSTLLGYVAAEVSRGGSFLGDPCQQGDVAIFGLEEFIGDAARRLKQFGADATRVHLIDRFVGDPSERVHEIRKHVEETGAVLVIVDTLMAYAAGAISDATSSTQMQACVQGLTDVAHDTGCALVLAHHARKSDGKYRDSSAIGGSVDLIVEMFTPDENADPRLRQMRARGRIAVPLVTSFRYDGDTYLLADGMGAVTVPVEQRIREVVRSRPGMSFNDCCDAVGGRRDVVSKAIHNMLATRELVNHGPSHTRMKLVLPTSDALGVNL